MILCDECRQQPAHIRLQVVNQGITTVRSLCPACAQQYAPPGVQITFGPPMPMQFTGLATLQPQLPAAAMAPLMSQACCQWCGYPWQQFQQTSMLGCPRCYDSFAPQMEIVLRRAQGGATRHTGKRPSRLAGGERQVRRQIEALRALIEEAIKAERYEEACSLRDEIRRLQAQQSEGGQTA